MTGFFRVPGAMGRMVRPGHRIVRALPNSGGAPSPECLYGLAATLEAVIAGASPPEPTAIPDDPEGDRVIDSET